LLYAVEEPSETPAILVYYCYFLIKFSCIFVYGLKEKKKKTERGLSESTMDGDCPDGSSIMRYRVSAKGGS